MSGDQVHAGLAVMSAEFTLPALGWRDRIRVLFGRPVTLESQTDVYRFTEIPANDKDIS